MGQKTFQLCAGLFVFLVKFGIKSKYCFFHMFVLQMYFMSKSMDSGPVYSVDFDPTYMFVALDSSLHILDFSSKATRAQVPC